MIPESLRAGAYARARENLLTVALTPNGEAQQDSHNLTKRAQVLRDVEAETSAALDAYYSAIVSAARARILLAELRKDDATIQTLARSAEARLEEAEATEDGPYCNYRDMHERIHAATISAAMIVRAESDYAAAEDQVYRTRDEAHRLTTPA